jgi:hypothetical protein
LSILIRWGSPQRANRSRKTVWVARGSTWLQKARGENHRPQDGAAGLVDDPEPRDLSAVGQGDVLRGIDLPGLVGCGGSLGLRAWPPGRRSRGEPGVVKPTTERARVGRFDRGSLLAEGDPDQDRSPGGVLTPQGQRGLADPIGIGVGQIPGRVRVGRHTFGSALTEPFPQMSHGTRGEAEGGGEGGGRLPLLAALE